MTDAQFMRILVSVRDGLLQTMRREGFYSVLPEMRHDEPTPWDINNGLCDDFAYGVVKAVAEQVRRPDDPRWPRSWENIAYTEAKVDVIGLGDQFPDYDGGDHVVVRRNGRYHDAECLDGVRDWRKLPIVVNSGLTREQAIAHGKSC